MDLILIIKAIVMGLVEGATEFLPVSSTGHLIITGELLDFLSKDKRDIFEIVIQLGAILAVVWEYRARFTTIATTLQTPTSQRLVVNLFLAFLPLAILGLAFHHKIQELLFNPTSVAIALIVGGFVMIAIEKIAPKASKTDMDVMDWKDALKIGFAQALALIPGTSRSAATIMGGMLFGYSRVTATEFSFFLAVPVMFAATGMDMLKYWKEFSSHDLLVFAAGFVVSFISALFAVKTLVRYVSKHDFKPFAYYRILLGVIVLAYFH